MSEDVLSYGVMVPLNRKLTREETEEYGEILYDQGSLVHFNYEGTLAFTDNRDEPYGISFGFEYQDDSKMFQDLEQFGLTIDQTKARSYRCMWYNGVDSSMSLMTLEKFLALTT